MNANELADLMEDMYPSVATMLRQQQAEIEALKESNKNLMELVTMLREEVNSLRQQQAEIEALKKDKWMTEVNVQQQTLAHIIKLLTIQHDTLACSSYPMSIGE